MSIYQKLFDAQKLFLESNPTKTGKNNYSNYNYFTLDDLEPALRRASDSAGIAYYTTVTRAVDGAFEAHLVIADRTSGEKIEIDCPVVDSVVKGASPMQNMGAVITYARRYLLLMAFGICEPDVLDENSGSDRIQSAKSSNQSSNQRQSIPKRETKSTTEDEIIGEQWMYILKNFGFYDTKDKERQNFIRKLAKAWVAKHCDGRDDFRQIEKEAREYLVEVSDELTDEDFSNLEASLQ